MDIRLIKCLEFTNFTIYYEKLVASLTSNWIKLRLNVKTCTGKRDMRNMMLTAINMLFVLFILAILLILLIFVKYSRLVFDLKNSQILV